ncbi:hypothetical protein B0H13DRAFT_1930164 [Mycena leptocephala]|nr:hypothetical protein B0H13DRAFT_1930164 [Mycena leptocephala]
MGMEVMVGVVRARRAKLQRRDLHRAQQVAIQGGARERDGKGKGSNGRTWCRIWGNREGVRLVQSVLSPSKVSMREKGKELGWSRFESRLKWNRCGTKTHLPQNSPPSTQPRSLPLMHKLFLSPTVGVLFEQPGQIPYEGTLEVVPRPPFAHRPVSVYRGARLSSRLGKSEPTSCGKGMDRNGYWERRDAQPMPDSGIDQIRMQRHEYGDSQKLADSSNAADAGVLQESGFSHSVYRSVGGYRGNREPLELSSTSKIVVVAGAPLYPRFPERKSGARIQISRSFGRVIGEIGEIKEIGAVIRALKCCQQKSKKALEVDRGWIASGRWAGCEAHSHHHYGAGGNPLDGGSRDHNGGKPPRADDG